MPTWRQRIQWIPEFRGFTAPVAVYSYKIPEKKEDEKKPVMPQIPPAWVVAEGLMDLIPLTSKQRISKKLAVARTVGAYEGTPIPDSEDSEGNLECYSTPLLELIKILKDRTWPPRTAEIVGGFGVMTAANIIQIWTTTLLEFGFRTAGAFFLRPMSLVHEADVEGKKSHPPILRIAGTLVFLPFWCIGKTLDLAGDVCSYTRRLLDSSSRLLNPVWWGCKFVHNIMTMFNEKSKQTPLPSIMSLARNFLTSAFQLLPAAFIVATGLVTGGVSVPILNALSAPLSAVGSAIVTPLSSSLAVSIAGGIGLGGAVSTVSKVFSGIVGGISDYIKPRSAEEAQSGGYRGSTAGSQYEDSQQEDSEHKSEINFKRSRNQAETLSRVSRSASPRRGSAGSVEDTEPADSSFSDTQKVEYYLPKDHSSEDPPCQGGPNRSGRR